MMKVALYCRTEFFTLLFYHNLCAILEYMLLEEQMSLLILYKFKLLQNVG